MGIVPGTDEQKTAARKTVAFAMRTNFVPRSTAALHGAGRRTALPF